MTYVLRDIMFKELRITHVIFVFVVGIVLGIALGSMASDMIPRVLEDIIIGAVIGGFGGIIISELSHR